jgi:NADH pyrophosphatase NudC (nudix superfamily)
MKNYFQGLKESPFYLSVGAVLLNEKGKVACNYFKRVPGYPEIKDIYILMRETIEPNETIEQALARGLLEEFGAKARLNKYLGSLTAHFKRDQGLIQKTTLYFSCDLTEQRGEWRKPNDEEKDAQVVWKSADFLIPKMKGQRKYGEDLDESEVLEKL